ncbi:MAG TPA: PEP-CTERM sorting domain-containing protein [Pirellulales bacterium]|nr:PEP-CTERM sorting domain-containing protein [Pirellulales bacterium]
MRTHLTLTALALALAGACAPSAYAGLVLELDFSDVPPGSLSLSNPYISHGFTLTSTSGGFVVNSPNTGNGAPQTPGNNPFYAGATGLAAFTPATITLRQTSGDPFSLLTIDLARNFDFDPAPAVTFTGILAAGGTLSQTFNVTTIGGFPQSFQTFDFTGFTGLSSVSWDQPDLAQGLHQFGNIRLSNEASGAVPEPSTLALFVAGSIGLLGYVRRLKSKPVFDAAEKQRD